MKSSIIPIFIPHLGCPNNCVFCDQHKIASTVKEPDFSEVKGIIEQGLLYARKPQISFYGGSFTAIRRELMDGYLQTAVPFVESGLCDSIRLSTRPDAIDEDILETLRKYHVKTIELGAQSMCDRVLAASGRGHTAFDTSKASGLIKEYGFELILQMMVGLPLSEKEDELYTAEALCRLRPDGVRIYPTCVIDKTPLYDMYLAGRYKALSVDEAVDICADLLDIFEKYGVYIVRLGLNPTEELSNGGVKAGAYHPALGEMVYSRRFLKKVLPLVPKEPYDILVTPKSLSVAIGQKRCNLSYLKSISPLCSIKGEEGLELPFKISIR